MRTKKFDRFSLAARIAFAVFWIDGCASAFRTPDLSGLYGRAAGYHSPDQNPIIVIPGLTGSNLVDSATGRVVWGAFAGDYAHPGRAHDARLIALPLREGTPLTELVDTVVPRGVLDRVKLRFLGLPIVVKAYAQILAILGESGYRDEDLGLAGIDYGDAHYTCFQFDYDWRRDNVENAQRLNAFIENKRSDVREETRKRFGVDRDDVRFDIVAHSMGAVLLRYYLRFGTAELPAACDSSLSGTARLIASTGKPAVFQASRPPAKGLTRSNPRFRSNSATRALEASFGHVHSRTVSRSRGISW